VRKIGRICFGEILAISLTLSAGSCGPAKAMDLSRKFSLGFLGGLWKSGLTEHSDIYTVGNQWAFSFKYATSEKLAFSFSCSYAATHEADFSGEGGAGAGFTFKGKDDGNKLTHLLLDAFSTYNFRPLERFNPYILGGLGICFWKVKDMDGNFVKFFDKKGNPFDLKDQELTFIGGGGFEYRLKDRWAINLGTRFHYLTHVLTGFTNDKDVVGGGSGEFDLPKATLEVYLGLNYYFGKPKDQDKDGIPDRFDHCSDTPRGAEVDEDGCPLDSDEDGIYDGLDKCPDTPPRIKVDVNGCPIE
jgi:opacity protein-like surface antigen